MDYDNDAGLPDAGRRYFLKQAGAVALVGVNSPVGFNV